eukprot:CAMPEP_0194045542 /NCGR_PEP_ID=MMETSP0009_2-20130614/16848_1 /TAXON_ID=210454 /ORGANISM="Grammatophora oceanica, Strain CCMP 410" /LENGTH=102 /DNA_ID=CAMNT_0038690415 /DNA_START=93 /DNA_END=401 /DNA_ORIENTATION=-
MMKCVIAVLVVLMCIASTSAFVTRPAARSQVAFRQKVQPLNGFGSGFDDEPKTLTRESEPEEYFATNTDKMSDEEKIPIAIAGLLGISLPFILGLIALYAAK